MCWKLTSHTYWRREGDDIVLATNTAILRLNSISSRILDALVGESGISRFADQEIEELLQLLLAENMVERAGGEDSSFEQQVPYMASSSASLLQRPPVDDTEIQDA